MKDAFWHTCPTEDPFFFSPRAGFVLGLVPWLVGWLVGWLAASPASPASLGLGRLLALIGWQLGVAGGWFKLGLHEGGSWGGWG